MFISSRTPLRALLSGSLALAIASFSPAVSAFNLAGSYFDTAARNVGLAPDLLYAVALTESAYSAAEPGHVAPSCLAIRADNAYYPKTVQEARSILERILPNRKNVDIGCMQVNWRWHGHRVNSPYELLDPRTNISIAATILRDALDSVPPGQDVLGIGRYHHWDVRSPQGFQRAVEYGQRVLEILANLRALTSRYP